MLLFSNVRPSFHIKPTAKQKRQVLIPSNLQSTSTANVNFEYSIASAAKKEIKDKIQFRGMIEDDYKTAKQKMLKVLADSNASKKERDKVVAEYEEAEKALETAKKIRDTTMYAAGIAGAGAVLAIDCHPEHTTAAGVAIATASKPVGDALATANYVAKSKEFKKGFKEGISEPPCVIM